MIGRLALLASVGALNFGAGTAAAQDDDGDRVRAIEHRIRGIVSRIEAIDGSQRVEESPTEQRVTLAADVFFEFDKATLTSAALATLDEFAAEIRAEARGPITIVGHTDSIGTDEYNQELSEARAEAVRAALDERLPRRFRFEASGRGESEPVAPNENEDGSDNPEGRARNRRVEFVYAKSG